jgi:hypothetical protein
MRPVHIPPMTPTPRAPLDRLSRPTTVPRRRPRAQCVCWRRHTGARSPRLPPSSVRARPRCCAGANATGPQASQACTRRRAPAVPPRAARPIAWRGSPLDASGPGVWGAQAHAGRDHGGAMTGPRPRVCGARMRRYGAPCGARGASPSCSPPRAAVQEVWAGRGHRASGRTRGGVPTPQSAHGGRRTGAGPGRPASHGHELGGGGARGYPCR